ncbi:hypothetical protein Leryth_019955 [Lithospermum erythrorhizon]|nr:hypothetical protein Leryth_019955 [Lithospermum erythrorhizon]
MGDTFDDDEADQTISIKDYLDHVENRELEADLVLGGDEGKECTYNKGYMKRQAIFSCLTCTPDGNAGVCTACSLSCHEGHEIVELWTKRNFRCDCGNSKFGTAYCKLFPGKDVENSENSYNHNFKGLYCTCSRPYPDPNIEEQQEMTQCIVCEDWFHEEHMGLLSADQLPRDEEGEPLFEDFICQGCSVVFSFLSLYPPAVRATANQHNLENMTEDKVEQSSSPLVSAGTVENGSSSLANSLVVSEPASTTVEKVFVEEANGNDGCLKSCIESASSSGKCFLGVDLSEAADGLEKSNPLFLSKNWREVLCRCEQCANYYALKKINFLLDAEDSIAEYEKMATEKRNEKLQQAEDVEQSLLNNLDHVGKIEFLSGIADLKNEIHTFMDTLDPSKPVTPADVQQIFENLTKKRRRML